MSTNKGGDSNAIRTFIKELMTIFPPPLPPPLTAEEEQRWKAGIRERVGKMKASKKDIKDGQQS